MKIDSNVIRKILSGNSELLEKLLDERANLLHSCTEMVQLFKDGSHYETMNPYVRPCVKKAIHVIEQSEKS